MTEQDNQIWQKVAELIKAEGFELFDLQLPQGSSRTLKVFIASMDSGKNSVNLDDCARVSRKLDQLTELEELLPDNCLLEVSSPGINRHLRLPRHFQEAKGERVKFTLNSRQVYADHVLIGKIENVESDRLSVIEEKTAQLISLPFAEIKKARVDFKFGN